MSHPGDADDADDAVARAEPREVLRRWLRERVGRESVDFVETHVSILALSGDRVWKLKKAVRFPFVDLSTAALRRLDAERELALNRRFAPDVYVGLHRLDDNDAEGGDVVLEMRRMPDDRRLSAVTSWPHEHADECIDRIASELARIHDDAPRGTEIDDVARPRALLAMWNSSLDELRAFTPAVLDTAELARVADDADRYVAGRELLFEQRIGAGCICDGHGDLLADDVFCLDDGPRFLDCLEFDDQLRFGDVLADVGFLAMDLESLGHPSLATRLLDAYRRSSRQTWPDSLADFYIAYRALVRSKVACLAVDTVDTDAPWRARALLGLAGEHLARGRVRLVLIGGPPATGKTTLARELSVRTGWAALHSDEVRKELAGISRTASAADALDAGLYTPEWSARTYAALLASASERLRHGDSVILDASWSERARRAEAERLATDTSSMLGRFVLSLPENVADARAHSRAASRSDASDASTPVIEKLRSRFESWPDALTLDGRRSNVSLTSTVFDAVGYPR